MSTQPHGPDLLAGFIEKNGLSQRDAARAIGVSEPTMHDWLTGAKRPRALHRKAIAIWTRRSVPESAWEDDSEAARIANIRPFRPQRRAGGSR